MMAFLLFNALLSCTPPVPEDDSASTTDTALCTLHPDRDGDGHGDPQVWTHNCDIEGYVQSHTDCDDTDPGIHPGAQEFCNTLDDDCDGLVDEGDIKDETWYRDADSDGYGTEEDELVRCEPPNGYARYGGDCDDENSEAHPGAMEVCDEVDQDCDGTIDEDGVDGQTWFVDSDGDGHGSADEQVRACDMPEGYAASDDDCDDHHSARFPRNPEVCDNTDNDCDETVDEEAIDATVWFYDGDGDGHGDGSTFVVECDTPAEHVDDRSDCDDTNASRYPGATEVCNDIDEDCDGSTDEDVQSIFYLDQDSDGYGDENLSIKACEEPSGYVAVPGDCNDSDGGIKPGASEGCDETDEDCDGSIDEDPVDGDLFYGDSDGDGYGDAAAPTLACELNSTVSFNDEDCDDSDGTVHPDAEELCDSLDQDCDTAIDEGATETYYEDLDGDGWGNPDSSVEACSLPVSGYVEDGKDCYDLNSAAKPDQASFFLADRGDGSFDWNCDEVEEPEYPDEATCSSDSEGSTCEGDEGWAEGVPECAVEDDWIKVCNGAVREDGSCSGLTVSQTQSCR